MVNYLNENEKTYNSYLYRSFRKYGLENFSFRIIELCDQSDLNNREQYWIDYYNSYYEGYNENFGGRSSQKVDREVLVNYYKDNNVTVQELAEVFGIERTVAGRILKECDVLPKYYVSEEEKREICDEYLKSRNVSCQRLSKKYNRNPETISRILKDNGITVEKNGTPKSRQIIVYDAMTDELIMETYIRDFCEYLKNNNIVEDP